MKRMFFTAILAIVIAFSVFGQAAPKSPAKEVNVVMIKGSGSDSFDARILAAFQKSIVLAGYQLGNKSSEYTLEITFSLTELERPNASQKYVVYDITANFMDTGTRQSVIPIYAINSREAHFTLEQAQSRAVMFAERKINEEYKGYIESNFPG
jgi:hypothetical protein